VDVFVALPLEQVNDHNFDGIFVEVGIHRSPFSRNYALKRLLRLIVVHP
jgi:hypothetical protein